MRYDFNYVVCTRDRDRLNGRNDGLAHMFLIATNFCRRKGQANFRVFVYAKHLALCLAHSGFFCGSSENSVYFKT